MNKDIETRVITIVAAQFARRPSDISRETSFVNDLNADSLDALELIMECEDEFRIAVPDEDADAVGTVGEMVIYIRAKIGELPGDKG